MFSVRALPGRRAPLQHQTPHPTTASVTRDAPAQWTSAATLDLPQKWSPCSYLQPGPSFWRRGQRRPGCSAARTGSWRCGGWCPSAGWPAGTRPLVVACGHWSRTRGGAEPLLPRLPPGAAAQHAPRRCWRPGSRWRVWCRSWCAGHWPGWAPGPLAGLVPGTSTPGSPRCSAGGPAPQHGSGAPSSNHCQDNTMDPSVMVPTKRREATAALTTWTYRSYSHFSWWLLNWLPLVGLCSFPPSPRIWAAAQCRSYEGGQIAHTWVHGKKPQPLSPNPCLDACSTQRNVREQLLAAK